MGVLSWREGGSEHSLFVTGGFVEVKADTVRVVSEAGERPEEIDLERARAAEQRARERLDQGRESSANFDILRAEVALRRAQYRLRLARQPRV
jgi:F-type H+-transporting ATPase subunit epsilon